MSFATLDVLLRSPETIVAILFIKEVNGSVAVRVKRTPVTNNTSTPTKQEGNRCNIHHWKRLSNVYQSY